MPIFNISDNFNVVAQNVLIYAINEDSGLITYLSATEDTFSLLQDNVYQIDMGKLSTVLLPGNYILQIFGTNPVLENLTIKEISPTKYEIRLSQTNPLLIPSEQDVYQNFDLKINDIFYPILSSVKDIYATGINQNTLILKLLSPIQSDVIVNTQGCSICEHIFNPVVIRVKIEQQENQLQFYRLRNAYQPTIGQTGYLNQQDIYSTASFSYSVQQFISQSQQIYPNIDFRYFQNHIFFGSAERVFTNAHKKISDWLVYDYQNYLISGSSSLVNLSTSFVDKQREIENGLTMYEKWLFTSSDGWPKYGTTNYTLYAITSSQYSSWYEEQSTSASAFDKTNKSYIINLVPEYFIQTDTYEVMDKFLHMIADHFDQLKLYIDHMVDMMHIGYESYDNIPEEFMWLLGKLLGFELYEGFASRNLLQYYLGSEISGSSPTENYRNITFETWSRILNNLIYIYKTKGTVESIRALINCYGIPSTLLKIREYIYHENYTGSDFEQYIIEPETQRYLLFTSSQQINTDFVDNMHYYDFTIEGRFKTSHRMAATNTMNLFGFDSNTFYVALKADSSSSAGGELGLYIGGLGKAGISSGAGVPFFDGNFYNISLVRTGSSTTNPGKIMLNAKRYNENQLFVNTSSNIYNLTAADTASITSSTKIQLGGNFASNDEYTGSVNEFRFWNRALSDNELNYHTYHYKSMMMDDPINSYQTNYIRWKLADNKDLSTDQYVVDTSLRTNNFLLGHAINYPSLPANPTSSYWQNDYLENRLFLPNIGPSIYSNKIRIGNVTGIVDSPKISITFAPTDVINEDMMLEFGNLDFNVLLGEPGNLYSSSYSTLIEWQNMYFSKYLGPFNFYNFIKSCQQMDNMIYQTLQQLVPCRVIPSFGILIESHLLERNKFDWKPIHLSSSSNKGDIEILNSYDQEGECYDNIKGFVNEITNYISGSIEEYLDSTNENTLLLNNIYCTGSREVSYSGSNKDKYCDDRLAESNNFDWIENRGGVFHQLRYVTFYGTQNDSAVQTSVISGNAPLFIVPFYSVTGAA